MQGYTGKSSLAWNSVYVALDSEAAHGFARLAGPRARRADRPPPQQSSSGVKRMFGCFCGAPANAMQPHLQIQTAAGSWRTVQLPSGLSAIMIENLPKRWANGDDFWDKDREARLACGTLTCLLCAQGGAAEPKRRHAGDCAAASCFV